MKQEANRMIIQSKKIWLADQFVAGQIEVVDGKIVGICITSYNNYSKWGSIN